MGILKGVNELQLPHRVWNSNLKLNAHPPVYLHNGKKNSLSYSNFKKEAKFSRSHIED
jgi:hypothetical protein